ncbi:MAG: heavy-metal-associated domain-containing protein, partial [Bifidobacteriaceae bacterium]|nr:heavy-metal-associated domain-containing protein [Bifidobacteriaceae bacterium]
MTSPAAAAAGRGLPTESAPAAVPGAPAAAKTAPPGGPPAAVFDFAVGGMSCASCVARVEKKINKLPGAHATVNLALETAHVECSEPLTAEQIVQAVEAAGYTAHLAPPIGGPRQPAPTPPGTHGPTATPPTPPPPGTRSGGGANWGFSPPKKP